MNILVEDTYTDTNIKNEKWKRQEQALLNKRKEKLKLVEKGHN